MACGSCAERRRRLLSAARSGSVGGTLREAAKGAVEILGVKSKTALEETRVDAGKAARLARRSSPAGAWPTE